MPLFINVYFLGGTVGEFSMLQLAQERENESKKVIIITNNGFYSNHTKTNLIEKQNTNSETILSINVIEKYI